MDGDVTGGERFAPPEVTGSPHVANNFERALIDRLSRHADVQRSADRRLANAAFRNFFLDFEDTLLDELLMQRISWRLS